MKKITTLALLAALLAGTPAVATADDAPIEPTTPETKISNSYGITMDHGPNGHICVNYRGKTRSDDLVVCGMANEDKPNGLIDTSKVSASIATDTLMVEKDQERYDALLKDGMEACLNQYTGMILDLAQGGPRTFDTRGTIDYSLEEGKFSAQYSLNDDGTIADHMTDRQLSVGVQWEGDKITRLNIIDSNGTDEYVSPLGKNIYQTGQFPQYQTLIDGLEKVLNEQRSR